MQVGWTFRGWEPLLYYSWGDVVIDLIYAFAITVMAISLIWKVCEGVIAAMQELDEDESRKRERDEDWEA